MSRENLYVLATRAKEKTTFYVATHDLPFDEDDRVDQARTDPRAYAAREILLNIIATEGAPLSATETIATAQEKAGSLATLVPHYLYAAHCDAQQRYATAASAAAGGRPKADLQDDWAWPAVVRRVGSGPAALGRRRPARARQRRQRRRSPHLAARRLPRCAPGAWDGNRTGSRSGGGLALGTVAPPVTRRQRQRRNRPLSR
jgi:hypothetical protein